MSHPVGYKLFVGGLPGDITEDDLYAVFPTYGKVLGVYIVSNSAEKSKSGQRCAFVTYERRQSAEDAVTVLDGKYKIREGGDEIQPIQVSWPREKSDKGKGKGDYGGDKGGKYNGGYKSDGCKGGYKGGGKDKAASYGGYGGPPHGNGYDGYRGGPGGYDSYHGGWLSSGYEDHSWGGGKSSSGGKGWNDRGSHQSYGSGGDYGRGADYSGKGNKGSEGAASGNNGKLFVGNLPSDVTEDALRYVFNSYGKVDKVHIMTGRAKSGQACAFVEYLSHEEAETAIITLNDKYEIKPGDGPIMVKRADSNRPQRPSPY